MLSVLSFLSSNLPKNFLDTTNLTFSQLKSFPSIKLRHSLLGGCSSETSIIHKSSLNDQGDFLAFTLVRLEYNRSQLHMPLRHGYVDYIFASEPSLHQHIVRLLISTESRKLLRFMNHIIDNTDVVHSYLDLVCEGPNYPQETAWTCTTFEWGP